MIKQFDIKYRPQIESGEYKVVTENYEPARIICWDSTIDKERPIIAIVFDNQIEQYKADGRYYDYDTSNYDLFIVTPEEEMSEFGMKLSEFAEAYELAASDCESEEYKTCNGNLQLIIDKYAAELLDLARKEILKGENIMTVSGPGLFSEGETRFTNMPIADVLKAEYEKGKAEALKEGLALTAEDIKLIVQLNEKVMAEAGGTPNDYYEEVLRRFNIIRGKK